MPITFQKRQKEMKRQEKAKMKAERRAQKKLEKAQNPGAAGDPDDEFQVLTGPAVFDPDSDPLGN